MANRLELSSEGVWLLKREYFIIEFSFGLFFYGLKIKKTMFLPDLTTTCFTGSPRDHAEIFKPKQK